MRLLLLLFLGSPLWSQVTITPASVSVAPKGTVQFATSAKSPRWSWTGAGSLSQSGLYTAPDAVPVSPFDVVQVSVTDASTFQSAMATLMIIKATPSTGTSEFTAYELRILHALLALDWTKALGIRPPSK